MERKIPTMNQILENEVLKHGVKSVLMFSPTEEVADQYVIKYTNIQGQEIEDCAAKSRFLDQIFEEVIIHGKDPNHGESVIRDYWINLTTIINLRWGEESYDQGFQRTIDFD